MMSKTAKRVFIDGYWYRVNSKTGKPSKVPLTRCNNQWTESEWRSWILSGLRSKTMMWPPAQQAWKLNVRPNQSGSRHKYEHQCAICKDWFVKKKVGNRNSVELDHIVNCGGLNDLKKFAEWADKAYTDTNSYQKLCIACHNFKSLKERRQGKDEKK